VIKFIHSLMGQIKVSLFETHGCTQHYQTAEPHGRDSMHALVRGGWFCLTIVGRERLRESNLSAADWRRAGGGADCAAV